MKNINLENMYKMLSNAEINLVNNAQIINNLNVFPVPDGDTGNNMLITFSNSLQKAKQKINLGLLEFLNTFKDTILFAARGNSGVILSQFVNGFFEVLIKNSSNINNSVLIEAFINSEKVAYKSVHKPVEGTILTIIKDVSNFLKNTKKKFVGFKDFFNKVLSIANESLENTPNLLPILKESNVVDSGAYGLVIIIEGIAKYFQGEFLEVTDKDSLNLITNNTTDDVFTEDLDIDYSEIKGKHEFCTELIVLLHEVDDKKNKILIDSIKKGNFGDSIVTTINNNILKLHIHTDKPYLIMQHMHSFGNFIKLKIENMTLQVFERSKLKQKEPLDYLMIAVITDPLQADEFLKKGTTHVILSKQSVNTSTDEFLKLMKNNPAKKIIILPNNSNIILAAEQAKEIFLESNPDISFDVIKTKNIHEGLVFLDVFSKHQTVEETLQKFKLLRKQVNWVNVTYSIKNSKVNGIEIEKGDFLIFEKNKLVSSTKDIFESLEEKLTKENYEYDEILIFYSNHFKYEIKSNLNRIFKKINEDAIIRYVKTNDKVNILDILIE